MTGAEISNVSDLLLFVQRQTFKINCSTYFALSLTTKFFNITKPYKRLRAQLILEGTVQLIHQKAQQRNLNSNSFIWMKKDKNQKKKKVAKKK